MISVQIWQHKWNAIIVSERASGVEASLLLLHRREEFFNFVPQMVLAQAVDERFADCNDAAHHDAQVFECVNNKPELGPKMPH